MIWHVKRWNDLTPAEIWSILDLRIATFVVEQQRIYHEVDAHDHDALHVFATENDHVIAYARIFTADNHVTFGRVVTSPQVRGRGVGAALLAHIMAAIKVHFPKRSIEIEAQIQVQKFYEKDGFTAVGTPFIFESTPHIKMVHPGFQN